MKPHILVVDDEPAVLAVAVRTLRGAGYRVTGASNGHDALAAIDTGDFDLLITDVRMPEMSGDELSRRARLEWSDLPVLYLTGYADQLFGKRKTLREREAFLEKPFTPTALEEAVATLLASSEQANVRE